MITQKELNDVPPRSLEKINTSIEMAWVRHKTGINRGEDRKYEQFDRLLDERNNVKKPNPLAKQY